MKPQAQRMYFLDWVRIIAFLLLILYHVGMYYVSWDWHVKSVAASDAIEPLMLLSSPWRLSLLFLIAGVAASFMLAKTGAAGFMRQRSLRLLVPLIFGMLVIVPPQPYFEVIEKVAYQGSYGDFMRLYLSGYGDFCRDRDCLDLPTWNHLWFVAYLWVYTMVFGAALMLLGARFDRLAAVVTRHLGGWKLVALPVLVLGAARYALIKHFPTTHGLVDDWYNHANYLTLFVLGAILARSTVVWEQMNAMRWTTLGIALACWGALIIYYSLPEELTMRADLRAWRLLMRAVYVLCAWSAMLSACGFAHRHLNRDGASRRYLTEAVFPVYILHQTLIVSIAHLIKPATLAPAIEAMVLIVLTLCISFGAFEIIRRVSLLRPLFGLSWDRRIAKEVVPQSEKPATAHC